MFDWIDFAIFVSRLRFRPFLCVSLQMCVFIQNINRYLFFCQWTNFDINTTSFYINEIIVSFLSCFSLSTDDSVHLNIYLYNTVQSSHAIQIKFQIYFQCSIRLRLLLLFYCSSSGFELTRFQRREVAFIYVLSALSHYNQSCRARAIK